MKYSLLAASLVFAAGLTACGAKETPADPAGNPPVEGTEAPKAKQVSFKVDGMT